MYFRIPGCLCLALTLFFGVAAVQAKSPDSEKAAVPAASAEKKIEKKKSEKKSGKKKAEKKKEQSKKDETKNVDKKPEAKTPPVQTEQKSAPPVKPSPAKAPEQPAAKPAKPTPPTYTVKKDVLKIQIEIEGAFEAEEMIELALQPEEWSSLKVLEAVPHGTKVKKGDVVLKLDPEKLDDVLTDVRRELQLMEIALKENREELAAREKTTPLDLEAGQRGQRNAQEDQKYYFDIARAEALKSADYYLKYMKNSLEYERQELAELEKMYKADDLVEETEKIVLQRQRDRVEQMEFYLHQEEIDRDRFLKYTLPRRDEQVTDAMGRQSIQWQKAKIDLPLALDQKRLEVKKLEVHLARTRDKLKKLEADRKLLTVVAPMDGYVYYGKCRRGRFNESAGLAEALRPGGGISPNQVFMTIVNSRPVFLRTVLSEANLNDLHLGSQGIAVPTALPDLRLPVTIDQIGAVPMMPGNFDARLDVTLEAKDKMIMPGMGCKVKFTPYLKTDALVVPPKAVFSEPEDDDDRYVYVLDGQGKPEKRSVTVGRETNQQVEIRKGLRAGDKILLEKPKDE
ncbi:MAG: hypothetical protein JXB10_01235 [Pirellulales bacterium]|nr:hypothetical protein [Pirellulales bacterium]